jgi:hypothetical protein
MVFAIAYTVIDPDCPLGDSSYLPAGPVICQTHDALAAMAIIQMILLGIWISWLSRLARHTPGRTTSQAFRLPAHRLIHRDADGPGRLDRTFSQEGPAEDPFLGEARNGSVYLAEVGITPGSPGHRDAVLTPYDVGTSTRTELAQSPSHDESFSQSFPFIVPGTSFQDRVKE